MEITNRRCRGENLCTHHAVTKGGGREPPPNENGVIYYKEMKMVFELGSWPVLKTIMGKKKHDQNKR